MSNLDLFLAWSQVWRQQLLIGGFTLPLTLLSLTGRGLTLRAVPRRAPSPTATIIDLAAVRERRQRSDARQSYLAMRRDAR